IIIILFIFMYGKSSIAYFMNSLFHSFKYDINDLRSYLITISMIYNPKSLILFSTIKFNIIKTLYFFMTFLNTDKMKLVACMTLLTVIFQVITVIISWLITKRDELLWNKRTVKEYFIVLLLSVVIIGTAAVNLYIVGFILVILSFGISALSDFNRILLNNSFISFISFVVITSYSNENAVMILDVFISVIVALYICEWIVADIGYLKTMSNDETSAVKNAFDSILGTGLLGSIIWLIFILIKRLI
ncbi:mutant sensor protein, partial [Lactobacillus acidophilus]